MIEFIRLLLPEIILSAAALFLLGLDLFPARKLKSIILTVSILSLLAALILLARNPLQGRAFGMLVNDSFSTFFKILAVLSALLILLISEKDPDLMGPHAGSFTSLILLSTVGTMFLSSAEDFLILFGGHKKDYTQTQAYKELDQLL